MCHSTQHLPALDGVRYRAAQALASVWRFNGLRLANLTFTRAQRGAVLERPLFGYRMPLDVGRTSVHQMLYLEGERFMAERFLLRRLIDPGMNMLDVGANIGYYLLLFRQATGPNGFILCVEPEPDNVADLRAVIARNHMLRVEVLEAAVGSQSGTAHLMRGINSGVIDGEGDFTVPLLTIDEAWDAPRLGRVNFIKIDVEGYEGHVLDGAAETLKQRPKLFVEIHPAMLAKPYTVTGIYESLLSRYEHRGIAFYENNSLGAYSKMRAQYLDENQVRRVHRRDMLAACQSGEREATFWMVCH